MGPNLETNLFAVIALFLAASASASSWDFYNPFGRPCRHQDEIYLRLPYQPKPIENVIWNPQRLKLDEGPYGSPNYRSSLNIGERTTDDRYRADAEGHHRSGDIDREDSLATFRVAVPDEDMFTIDDIGRNLPYLNPARMLPFEPDMPQPRSLIPELDDAGGKDSLATLRAGYGNLFTIDDIGRDLPYLSPFRRRISSWADGPQPRNAMQELYDTQGRGGLLVPAGAYDLSPIDAIGRSSPYLSPLEDLSDPYQRYLPTPRRGHFRIARQAEHGREGHSVTTRAAGEGISFREIGKNPPYHEPLHSGLSDVATIVEPRSGYMPTVDQSEYKTQESFKGRIYYESPSPSPPVTNVGGGNIHRSAENQKTPTGEMYY